jgi:hypothetical protein
MSRKYKISTIYQADDAINDLNNSIERANRNLEQQIERVRRDAERSAQLKAREETNRAMSEMQQRLDRSVQGVNARISQVDNEQRQRLRKVADNLYGAIIQVNENLHDEIGSTRQELKNDIRSLERRTNERIQHLTDCVRRRFDEQQAQLDSHEAQISNLNTKVNDILAQLADESQKRREAVSLALDIQRAAYGRIDMDRFSPKSDEIKRRIKALQENPNDEGTVGTAREVILQIQMAEEEALRNKIIYDAIHAEATAMLDKVLEEVNSNRVIKIDDPTSQDVFEIETDFWTRGEYKKLQSELEKLKKELNQQPSVERIKEIVTEVAKAEVLSADMLNQATNKAILSENRVIMVEDIVNALLMQGWRLEIKNDERGDEKEEVGYLGGEDCDNDWREGVYAILNSGSGECISIVVRPDENEKNNEIIFHRNDDRNITDKEYIQSLERIKKQIEKSGFKLGNLTAPADGGDTEIPEMTDASRLGSRGAAQTINQRTKRK